MYRVEHTLCMVRWMARTCKPYACLSGMGSLNLVSMTCIRILWGGQQLLDDFLHSCETSPFQYPGILPKTICLNVKRQHRHDVSQHFGMSACHWKRVLNSYDVDWKIKVVMQWMCMYVCTSSLILTRKCITWSNVPWSVLYAVQIEILHALDRVQMVRNIDLVCKKESRNALCVCVLQHGLQFLLDNAHPQLVGAVYNKNDSLSILVVVLPKITVFTSTGHVKHGEIDGRPRKLLHIESHCWCDLLDCALRENFQPKRNMVSSWISSASNF